MKILSTLLLLIPSLSWGLTFKDGKQVEEETKGPDGEDILKDLELIIQ